jgi:hypothetical protein
MDIAVELALGSRKGGFYEQYDSPRSRKLSLALQRFYAALEPKNQWRQFDIHPLIAVVEAAIDIEEIFIHIILATGAEKLLYHGDDEHTPNNLRFAAGRERFNERFDRIPPGILDQCRSEINQLFPVFAQFADSREDASHEDVIQMSLLWFSFIDILVALRTNSRAILFNTDVAANRLLSRLPAANIKDAVTFLNMFDHFEGPVLVPRPRFELTGFDQGFFGSKEFMSYCSAHDLLNSARSNRVTGLEKLQRAVISTSEAYEKLIERSTMAFAVSKLAAYGLNAIPYGAFGYAKDFVELVVRLCKDFDRNLTLYSGNNFEQFCAQMAMNSAFGSVPIQRSRWSWVKDTLLWRKST